MNRLFNVLAAGCAGLALAACGGGDPESAEQAAENYAASHGIDADVEVDESGEVTNVTINTAGGQVGTNLDLPDGFPDDVSLPGDWSVTASTRVPPDGFSIQLMSKATPAEAMETLRASMTADGWTETASSTATPQFSQLGFEKGGRMANFTIMDNQGEATVQLVTMTRP